MNNIIFNYIKKGDISSALEYIKTHKNIDIVKKRNGVNILMEAIVSKQDAISKYIINANIDINAQDKAGFSALHYCVWEKNIAIAKLLLEKGANVNIIDKYGNNPFWYSLTLYRTSFDIDFVKLLIIYGADIHNKNYSNLSPYDFAKILNDDNINEILSKVVNNGVKTDNIE